MPASDPLIDDLAFLVDEATGDLLPSVKDTIGKYIAVQASGFADKRTRSRFAPVPSEQSELELSLPSGDPAPIEIPDGGSVSAEDLQGRGVSQFFLAALKERKFIRKGGQTTPVAPEQDGHTLLKNTAAPDLGAAFYSNFLVKTNRFNVETSGPGPKTLPPPEGRWPSLQNEFLYNKRGIELTSARMAKVGQLLSLRSTGEFFANGPTDPNNPGIQISTLIPGEGQLINPLGMDASRLSANAALRDILIAEGVDPVVAGNVMNDLFVDDDAGNTDGKYAGRSFGVMNNHLEHFSGLLPLGTAALAVALALATFVGMQALMLILGGFAFPSRLSVEDDGTLTLGKHARITKDGGLFDDITSEIGKFLGLAEVGFDYGQCVEKGFEVFFGLADEGAAALKRVALEQPGYYATFSRLLTRGVASVADSISTASAAGAVDFVSSATGIVDAIRQSRIIKVLNYFADIGNKRLLLDVNDQNALKLDPMQDLAGEQDVPAIAKNREQGSRRLAWRSGGTKSMMMIVPSLLRRPSPKSGDMSRHSILKVHPHVSTNVTPETRRALEAELDAEYVPFYFHDTRTNEIISFHAFLSELNESYEPQYNDSEALGRIDNVMTYKRTARRVNLAFSAVATNPDDFDLLWVKINKLTTLVYPRWTRGRQAQATVLDQNNKEMSFFFTQPFSQLMSDSPLIRLRVGDLVRSNYSRFALARLFGLGNNVDSTSEDANAVDKLITDVYKPLTEKAFKGGDVVQLRATSDPVSSAFNTGYRAMNDSSGFLDKVVSALPFIDNDLDKSYPLRNTRPIDVTVISVSGKELVIAPRDSFRHYKANVDDIIIDPRLILEPSPPKNFEAESLFFGEADANETSPNPVVRSFEETGGKGLAGFITSLSFDWKDMPWETTRYGARAPLMCQIKLSLTAIHDIMPGIDNLGFNRAPIYNVGGAMNGIGGDADDLNSLGRRSFDNASNAINTLRRK